MDIERFSWGGKTAPIFLLLILFSLHSYALSSGQYSQYGDISYTFISGESLLNNNRPQAMVLASKGLTDGLYTPLTGDMDGDGQNEIVAFDGGTLRIYDKSLNILDAVTLQSPQYGIPVLFDITGDGHNDIIITTLNSSSPLNVSYYSWNGSSITQSTHILNSFVLTSQIPRYSTITCTTDLGNRCLIVADFSSSGSTPTNNSLQAFWLDSSGELNNRVLLNSSGSSGNFYCLPNIAVITPLDVDNDGDTEYTFTIWKAGIGVDKVELISLYPTDSNIQIEHNTDVNTVDATGSGGSCDTNIAQIPPRFMFTSPLVYDIDGSPGNGAEAVYGTTTTSTGDPDKGKIYQVSMDNSIQNSYPATGSYDVLEWGNGFINSVNGDDIVDFCFSHTTYVTSTDGRSLDINCASVQQPVSLGFDDKTFIYSGDIDDGETSRQNTPFNISARFKKFDIMVNAINTGVLNGDPVDSFELVTSYGILALSTQSCTALATCNMYRIHQLPESVNSGAISADIQNVGYEDILITKQNSITLYDDGFQNTHCGDGDYCFNRETLTINPCLPLFRTDSEIQISAEISDVNHDNVSGQVIIYFGTDNEQSTGWVGEFASGETFAFVTSNMSIPLVANKTGSGFILRIMARDSDDPSSVEIIDKVFGVSDTGAILNSCTTIGVSPTTTSATNGTSSGGLGSTDVTSDNYIDTQIDYFSGLLGVGKGIIWLVLMCLFIVVVVVSTIQMRWSGTDALAIIGIGEIIMLILGYYLHFISGVIITVIIIVSLAILALTFIWFFRKPMGG